MNLEVLEDSDFNKSSEHEMSTLLRRSEHIKNISKDYRTIENEKHANFDALKRGFIKVTKINPLAADIEPRFYKKAVNNFEAPY